MKILKKISEIFEKKSNNKMREEILDKIRIIRVNDNGFTISDSFMKIVDIFEWNLVENIELKDNSLFFYLKNGKKITIPSSYHENWYELIQKIPKGFSNYDYNFVENFINNLQGCEICGMIAIHEEECLCCGNKVWNNVFLDEYQSKEEYIKSLQLIEFDQIYSEKIKTINNKSKYGFKSFKDWKPLIKPIDFMK